MRGHHQGNPKTPRSRRTIEISDELVTILRRQIAGRAADDFVFMTPTGRPLHNADYYERVWHPLMADVSERAFPRSGSTTCDTRTSRLVAGEVPLPHIQARLGHESITTTIDTYGHLLPVGDALISTVVDTALRGGQIRPAPVMRLIEGGADNTAGVSATGSEQ